jgi:hypothetical protein
MSVLLTTYIFFSIFLPPLFPKKIIFILILISAFLYCVSKKRLKLFIINPLIILVFFLIYFCVGYGSHDESLAFQFFILTFSFFIIFTITESSYDVEQHLKNICVVFSLLIIYMSLGYFSNFLSIKIPFSDSLTAFFIKNNLGFIGFREFGSFKPPMLHFVSAPILLVSLLLIFDEFISENKIKNALPFFIVLAAILVSGSRGIVAFSFIGIFLIYFYRVGAVGKLTTIFLTIIIFALIIVNIDIDTTLFSFSEKSNSVKAGHFISFIDQLNFKQVLMGDGLASLYYTIGFDSITAQTEIFLLDSIRYFGMFGTLLFFILLLIPMKLNINMRIMLISRYKELPVVYLIFSLYLLMSFTNPILLNSYGIIVVLWFWSRVLSKKEIT